MLSSKKWKLVAPVVRFVIFISEEHKIQQGYSALDRKGNEVFHPLISLAIGVIQPNAACYASYHQIADLASRAKSEAKKKAGNNLFICRRRKVQSGDKINMTNKINTNVA